MQTKPTILIKLCRKLPKVLRVERVDEYIENFKSEILFSSIKKIEKMYERKTITNNHNGGYHYDIYKLPYIVCQKAPALVFCTYDFFSAEFLKIWYDKCDDIVGIFIASMWFFGFPSEL